MNCPTAHTVAETMLAGFNKHYRLYQEATFAPKPCLNKAIGKAYKT